MLTAAPTREVALPRREETPQDSVEILQTVVCKTNNNGPCLGCINYLCGAESFWSFILFNKYLFGIYYTPGIMPDTWNVMTYLSHDFSNFQELTYKWLVQKRKLTSGFSNF